MDSSLRIVFFGTPDFAVPAFSGLIETKHKIIAVITQSDQLVGRKRELTPPPIKVMAGYHRIPVLQPKTLKDADFLKTFRALGPDIGIVVAYGNIIPKEYLDVPKYGFINIHPSLLPKYRGPSPIQTAIMNGDEKTGITIMLLDEKMDHGPILNSSQFTLYNAQYYPEIRHELSKIGSGLLLETLPEYISGKIKPIDQDDSKATYCKTLTRDDGKIDWSWPPEKIYNLIRALSTEPGAWTTWKSKVMNIKRAELKDGKIILSSVQLEGKKETSFDDFLRGRPNFKMSDLV